MKFTHACFSFELNEITQTKFIRLGKYDYNFKEVKICPKRLKLSSLLIKTVAKGIQYVLNFRA